MKKTGQLVNHSFTCSRGSWAAWLLGALTWAAVLPLSAAGPGRNQEDHPIVWVWSGGITARSAVVKARLAHGTDSVRLKLVPASDPADVSWWPKDGSARPDELGFAAFHLDGLRPANRYVYTVMDRAEQGLQGRFMTFAEGPMSFRIAFASCASTGSNRPIFETIRELDPLFFLHMGDFHYEDVEVDSLERFAETYDQVMASPRQGRLYRSVPIVYMWDDHDFGPDDSDRTSPGKSSALEIYRRAVPHFPFGRLPSATPAPEAAQETSIQQAFDVGRVRFILSDLHSERDPGKLPDGPEKSLMGKAQRAWFLAELEKAQDYPLVVWMSTLPWITRSGPNSDEGWQPYSHERQLIADRIKALGLVRRLVMLSGDAHMVAIDDGTNSNYASGASPSEHGFPVIIAAPLDRYSRIKGGPYTHGTSPKSVWLPWSKSRQFGLMEVTDDGSTLDVTLTGRDEKGAILKGKELRLICSGGVCRVVRLAISR